MLKLFIWILRAIVFIGLFGLAIKNSGPMELRFFFEQSWIAPISVVVLVVFSLGVVVGATVAIGMAWRTKGVSDAPIDPQPPSSRSPLSG